MRRPECGRLARFALEAPHQRLAPALGFPACAADELDRRRTRQQTVLGQPHFTHATGANPLNQRIAADLARIFQLQVNAVDNAGSHVRHDGDR